MGMSNEELLDSLQQMIDTAEKRMAEKACFPLVSW